MALVRSESRSSLTPCEVSPLVRRAQRGDEDAFDVLYEESIGRVYALCLRLSGDTERAEELTQDVFVRAWEKLDSFHGESAFATWLQRLAVNVVLRSRRTEGRRAARLELVGDVSDLPHAAPSPRPETGIDLERLVASLPAGARAVFVLHDVEGYRHGEIAELLGIAEGTCKAQLHRARKLLRERWKR